ncbi:MAG: hypothetical protein NC406_01900 [Bacteroides sp.]|nr:hypothetical protein [Bacteroides sp.]
MKKILLLFSLIFAAVTGMAQAIDNLPIDKFGYLRDAAWESPVTKVHYLMQGIYDDSDGVRLCLAHTKYKCQGVVADAGDMELAKVVVTWVEPDKLWWTDPENPVVLEVYGRDTPYTSVEDLADESTRGVKIGEVTSPGTVIEVTGGYSYVGLCKSMIDPNDDWEAELSAIEFYWSSAKEAMEDITVTNAAGIQLSESAKYAVTGTETYVISSATPDVTFTWSMGSQSGTGVGSAYVTVSEPGVLNISAEKDGFISRERTVEFAAGKVIKSIYDAWEAYPMPDAKDQNCGVAFPVDFDATVVYAANIPAGAVVIIYDGTNFSRIYWPLGKVDLAPGDVIAKGWYATFGLNHAWKNFLPVSPFTVASHDGEIPAPVVIGSEEALQAVEPGTPVVVKGVILSGPTSSEVYDGDDAFKQIQTKNSPVALVNAFGIASVDSARYDVYGVMDFYGYKRTNAPAAGPIDADFSHRRWRVAVTEFELWKPTSPRPQFALANDSEVDSGEPIVITCQDEDATIMYSMDGETYAEYDAANPPVMPAEDVTVSAYSRQEGYHDSAVRKVSLRYSGKAGITDITLDPAGAAEYYDLTGRRVDNPKAGMYIRVQSGRATKVIL